MRRWYALVLSLGVLLGSTVAAQDALSSQVLQLLTRVNSWTNTNTFADLRLSTGIPSTTTRRLYTDGTSLFWNGSAVSGSGSTTTPHNLLSATHPDTLAGAVTRGAVVVGNAAPAWAAVAVCASGAFLGSDGTDTACRTNGAALTSLTAANLLGALPAIDGTLLTGLNATNLTSGTVPLARLSGITTSQLNAAAAITYSQLSLAGSINLSSDTDVVALPFAKGGTGLTAAADDTTLVSSGAAWVARTLTDCNGAGKALNYTQATNLFSCGTVGTGAGTVTSVALALPAILTVSGSPVTTTGTLTATLATQTANTLFAGPATGAVSAPTFRVLVNADLPLSGVAAGTYASVTVNTAGVVTAATTTASLTTQVTGTLPRANGGTGVAVSADDTFLVGDGTGWVATALPNCTTGILQYATASNTVTCGSTLATLTSAVAGSTTVGSTALPFGSLIVGTAATNNLTVIPAAFAQGTVATADDPGLTAVKLPLVRRGTIAYTGASTLDGACDTAATATITGLATTATVVASLNGAVPTNWKTGIYFLAYPTANTVNVQVCNRTGGTLTPASVTFNYTVVVP